MSRFHGFLLESNGHLLAHELGIPESDFLRRARYTEGQVARRDARWRAEEHFRFWEGLQAEVSDELFPVRVAEVLTGYTFGPGYFAALCSPDLLAAVRRIACHKRLATPVALDVGALDDALSLRFRWPGTAQVPPWSLVALEFALILRAVRTATRGNVRAARAVFPRPPPNLETYEQYLGCQVEVGLTTVLDFSAEDARRPFFAPDESLHHTLAPMPWTSLARLGELAPVQDRVRAVLLQGLPGGHFTMVAVADRLGTSKRTLQRRLSSEGTTFQKLVSRTREELATHYLLRTSLSCAEISFLLGFEDPNSFFRAFHEWTGCTPERTRPAPEHRAAAMF